MTTTNSPYLAEERNDDDPVLRESDNVIKAMDLLSAPTSHPETPRTLWQELPGYVLRISAPASGNAVMTDDYLMYDSQTMVD